MKRIIFAFVILGAAGMIYENAHAQKDLRPQEATADYGDASIKDITIHPEDWDGRKVRLTGIVDRYDDAAIVSIFHLEDDYGYRIKIQTSGELPSVKRKIRVWGTLAADQSGMELNLSMQGFAYSDTPENSAPQKTPAAHKGYKGFIFIWSLLLSAAVAAGAVFLILRKRNTVRDFLPAQGSPEGAQRNTVEQVDSAATIKIDLNKINIMPLAPTVKLLPGHFIITKGSNQGKTLPICFKEVIIGRACPNDPQNKIAIEDSFKTISRNQAIVTFENGVFFIVNKVDPASKNSICLNGVLMKKDQKSCLTNNSVLSVGYVEIKFVEGRGLAGGTAQVTAQDTHDMGEKEFSASATESFQPSAMPTAQTFVGRPVMPNVGDRATAKTSIIHSTSRTVYKK